MSENAVFCVMFFSFTYLIPVHFHFASGLLSVSPPSVCLLSLLPPLSSSLSQSVGVQRDRPVMAAEVLADDSSLCCHSLQPNGPDSNRLRWDCGFHWSCWSQSHTEICGIHSNTRQDLCVDLTKCPSAIKPPYAAVVKFLAAFGTLTLVVHSGERK